MDYQELIERLRDTNKHTFALWFEAADLIEQLQAENERLKAELAKYRDAPIVGWQWLNTGTYRKNIKNAALYRDWQPLIVKPDENQ